MEISIIPLHTAKCNDEGTLRKPRKGILVRPILIIIMLTTLLSSCAIVIGPPLPPPPPHFWHGGYGHMCHRHGFVYPYPRPYGR